MFEKIWSTELNEQGYSAPKEGTPEEQRHINLRRLNLFIGPNNSGKSRAIRAISYSSEKTLITTQPETALSKIYKAISQKNTPLRILLRQEVAQTFSKDLKPIATIKEDLLKVRRHAYEVASPISSNELQIFRSEIRSIPKSDFNESIQSHDNITITAPRTSYIPILRGMRPIDTSKAKEDLYNSRTTADYFTNDELRKPEIITGQHLYELLAKNLLSAHPKLIAYVLP